MSQAIGILELTSIAKGMELGDAMLKSANVNLLVSKTICPGKFLLMLGGDIGAIQQAIETGTSQAGEMLVDSLVLANIHPSVLPAISGLNSVDKRQAVGIVETWSVAACISAADRAVKGSNVTLVRVHMAFGIGGKCYMVVAGDVSDVNNAVTVASESAGEKGVAGLPLGDSRARMKPCGDRWWRDNGKTTTTDRMIQEYVPGKQVTLAHPDC
ncbi:propanediol utilization: polyhedral bodies pduT [Salmonella enterica subsp. enterica]|nr:propanediol utilization: polyhedral bodies pduT [Salmonella enterica subsp. enterica]